MQGLGLAVTQRSISRPYHSVLIMDNGQRWGTWGLKDRSPSASMPQVASYWASLVIGDNIALWSLPSLWGKWTDIKWCKSGMLMSLQLHVEPFQGTWDDTAANNIKFKCSGGEELQGSGTAWGSWSYTCAGKGVCGIETIVEEPRGLADDTALNDAWLYCCD
uniref:Vitelline membrane outer layer 1 homolog b n=1 Tax=Electrophorus electricus TaxID=8005 RepID=A0A4W4FGH5_ELEEL